VVPGHGPVTALDYLERQREVLRDWQQAVAEAVARGWTREETMQRVTFADRYPVDVGQGNMMEYIQTLNARSLYDKLTARYSS
jgi:cyclase